MLKKTLIGTLLGLSLFSATAFAELNCPVIEQELQNYSGWPLTAICIGSDVNLRTEPSTSCEVVTMLQPDDKFYMRRVIYKNDYNWIEGITDKGDKGYMVSKYLVISPTSTTRADRFEAALASSMIFDPEKFSKLTGYAYDGTSQKANPQLFGYAPDKIKIGPYWVHGEATTSGFDTIGVAIPLPGYKVAGLEVGDTLNPQQLETFNQDMQNSNWRPGFDNLARELETNHKLYWYVYDKVDGLERPVQALGLKFKKQQITEIQYCLIPID